MKRRSGRGRKPSNPANRSYESNGPDVKIRGNANQIYDKYLQYARDAQTSGDRINAEAYFQHAEHYFRIMMANQPKERPPQDDHDGSDDQDNEASADDQSGEASERQDRNQGRNRRNNRNDRNRDRDNNNVDEMKVVDGDSDDDQAEEASSDSESDEGERKETRRRRPARRRRNDDEASNAKASDDNGSDDDAGLRAMMARTPASDLDTDSVEAVDS